MGVYTDPIKTSKTETLNLTETALVICWIRSDLF